MTSRGDKRKRGVTSTAAAEKMAALLTPDSLEERARRGSREKLEAALAKLPDVEPESHDKL